MEFPGLTIRAESVGQQAPHFGIKIVFLCLAGSADNLAFEVLWSSPPRKWLWHWLTPPFTSCSQVCKGDGACMVIPRDYLVTTLRVLRYYIITTLWYMEVSWS